MDGREALARYARIPRFVRRLGDLGAGRRAAEHPFDVNEAARLYRATDDPGAELMVEILLTPPTPAEVVEDAEAREFAG
jgi:hypothetical protein